MIISDRVRLRAMEKDDLPRFVAWFNDPDVRRNLLIYKPLSMGQEEKWYQDILNRPIDEHPLCIEVLEGSNWVMIGNTGFLNINTHDRSAEVGISLGNKQFWDQGFGTDSLRLLVDHGFNQMNLNRIYLHVFETNLRGIRCYEKVGFKHEGRLREARFLDGKYIDVLVMSILKHEWKITKKKNGDSK
jgi:diamine N-acetyltransferase